MTCSPDHDCKDVPDHGSLFIFWFPPAYGVHPLQLEP